MTAQPTINACDYFPELTVAQRRVVLEVMKDDNNKRVARILGLSYRTVEQHKYEAFKRLGIQNAAQLWLRVIDKFGLLLVAS